MFAKLALTTLALLIATGCMHSVDVEYLEAARVDLGSDVKTVLVIDRSQSRGFEHVLDGIEGAATGEGFRLDAESAALALESLEHVLVDGQRFQVVRFQVNGRAVDTSRWDRQMAAHKVRELCARAQCDAVVALEAFDSDTLTAVTRDNDRFEAQTDVNVAATFRTYDGKTGQVLDQENVVVGQRQVARDDTPREAVRSLDPQLAVVDGAVSLGSRYGARISPHVVVDSRAFYGSGSPQMRQARKAANHGDLQNAATIWKAVADSSTGTLQAKALYNLAIAHEADGALFDAQQLAQRAARQGGKTRMHTYVARLNDRMANAELLQGQRVAVD